MNIYPDAEILLFFLEDIPNCPRHFAQMYSLHLALKITSRENYTYLVLFAFLPDKRGKMHHFC